MKSKKFLKPLVAGLATIAIISLVIFSFACQRPSLSTNELQEKIDSSESEEISLALSGKTFLGELRVPAGKKVTVTGPGTIKGWVVVDGTLIAKRVEFDLPNGGTLLGADGKRGPATVELESCRLKGLRNGQGQALSITCGGKGQIRSSKIEGFGRVMYTVGCAETSFEKVSFQNLGSGIYACTAKVSLSDCTFSSVTGLALYANCRSSVRVQSCRFTNSQAGIWASTYEGADVQIEGAEFHHLQRYAILITGDGRDAVTLNQNKFRDNGANVIKEELVQPGVDLASAMNGLQPIIYLQLTRGDYPLGSKVTTPDGKEVHIRGENDEFDYSKTPAEQILQGTHILLISRTAGLFVEKGGKLALESVELWSRGGTVIEVGGEANLTFVEFSDDTPGTTAILVKSGGRLTAWGTSNYHFREGTFLLREKGAFSEFCFQGGECVEDPSR